jgi:putative transposase
LVDCYGAPDAIRLDKAITDQWLVDYNESRPHEALGAVPPVQYLLRITHASNFYRQLSA